MRNQKQRWTAEEEEALRAGVAKHGTGKWKNILNDPRFSLILYSRSNIDLKDKWRNMSVIASGQRSRKKSRTRRSKANPGGPVAYPVPSNVQPPVPSAVVVHEQPADVVMDDSSKFVVDEKTALKDDSLIDEALSTHDDPNVSTVNIAECFHKKSSETSDAKESIPVGNVVETDIESQKIAKTHESDHLNNGDLLKANEKLLDKLDDEDKIENTEKEMESLVGETDEDASKFDTRIAQMEAQLSLMEGGAFADERFQKFHQVAVRFINIIKENQVVLQSKEKEIEKLKTVQLLLQEKLQKTEAFASECVVKINDLEAENKILRGQKQKLTETATRVKNTEEGSANKEHTELKVSHSSSIAGRLRQRPNRRSRNEKDDEDVELIQTKRSKTARKAEKL